MSTFSSPRRVPLGRAASPPTWAWYEQIPDDYSSESESGSDSESDDESGARDNITEEDQQPANTLNDNNAGVDVDSMDPPSTPPASSSVDKGKGKERQTDSSDSLPSPRRKTREQRHRGRPSALRPIVTIQRSQGFVWNQDLFVPPYMKDRYVASTSPSLNGHFVSSSVGSTNSAMTEYEPVDIVEIRVREGDLESIIPN
ncbi:hypothetical protein DL96DRAFT_1508298 [Flagelloscypha sp. PMI_526]|nr:hypothetical protein DL96DRAFT_1508298 [Flagelloscypha sp. PMI_526]